MSIQPGLTAIQIETQLKTKINTVYNKHFINNPRLRERLLEKILANSQGSQFIIDDLCIRGALIDQVNYSIVDLDNCLTNKVDILDADEMWIFFQMIKDSMEKVLKPGKGGYTKKKKRTSKRYQKKKRQSRKFRR